MSNENGAAVSENKARTKAVAGDTFAFILNRCNSIEEVIAEVKKETGIEMTESNVIVKASNLRKKLPHLKRLPRRTKGIDYAALDAALASQSNVEQTEKQVEETKSEAEAKG